MARPAGKRVPGSGKRARQSGSKEPSTPRSRHFIGVGDVVKIERRYVVDGSLTSVSDQGRFEGIQLLGSMEHIVLNERGDLRTIPLASISEITLVEAASREPEMLDPSFG